MDDMYADLTPPRLSDWPRDVPLLVRACALIEGVAELLWLDLGIKLRFRRLHAVVAQTRTASRTVSYDALAVVRPAIRDACVFYPKKVFCLQRSAAVTRMLRRRGLPASLVLGYQPVPLEGHAWVELNGVAVFDTLYSLELYRVIDRL
jgi:hypothetical protein